MPAEPDRLRILKPECGAGAVIQLLPYRIPGKLFRLGGIRVAFIHALMLCQEGARKRCDASGIGLRLPALFKMIQSAAGGFC